MSTPIDNPESYLDDFAQAAYLRLAGMPGITWERRMAFTRAPGDPAYVGVIKIETDGYGPAELMAFGGPDGRRKGAIEYTLRVGIISNVSDKLRKDDPVLLAFREQARQRLDEPALAGAASVFNTELELGDVYDDGALSGGFNSSSMRLIGYSMEPLTGAAKSNRAG